VAGPTPRIMPFGEAAFLVVLGERISVPLNRRTHALDAAVRTGLPASDGWGTPVPAYASLLVPYDPERLDPATARDRLEAVVAAAGRHPLGPERGGRLVEIPVRYGGPDGPDLAEVAERLGMDTRAVVRAHAGRTYRVYLLGFVPGFAYLGMLSPRLVLPRRPTPRPAVPPGSVGIAASQTAVYPVATPGGWHLIGRTDLPLWDPAADPPAGLAPGDRVRFVSIDGRRPR
jgi:KipI family sensor histidine kinase inhibitor